MDKNEHANSSYIYTHVEKLINLKLEIFIIAHDKLTTNLRH